MAFQAHCILCGKEFNTDWWNYGIIMSNHYQDYHQSMCVVYKPIYLCNTTNMSNEDHSQVNPPDQQSNNDAQKDESVETVTESIEKGKIKGPKGTTETTEVETETTTSDNQEQKAE